MVWEDAFHDEIKKMVGFLLTIFFVLMMFSIKIMRHNPLLFIFLGSFFTFLIGAIFIGAIEGYDLLYSYEHSIKLAVIRCLVLSILGILTGALICVIKNNVQTKKIRNDKNISYDFSILRSIALIMFYITIIPRFLQTIDIAINVVEESYISYYSTYTSSIPYIIIKVGELNLLALLLMFAVDCEKRKMVIPIILSIIVSSISLLGGQRNVFVLDILLLVYCLFYANNRARNRLEKRWLNNRHAIVGIIIFPFLLYLLFYIGYWRNGISVEIGIIDAIKSFFTIQGGQVDFIAKSIVYKNIIWEQNVPYTFYSFYDYLSQNIVSRIIFDIDKIGLYTAEYALKGNSLSATLYYIISPSSFLSGRGMGGNYIAELFIDFGEIGVYIGNVIIGIILVRIGDLKNKPWWITVILMIFIRWIIYIPRSSFFSWVVYGFSLTNIFFIIGVFIIYKIILNYKQKKYNWEMV